MLEANYLRDSSTATARSTVIPTMGSDPTAAGGGEREGSAAAQISNLLMQVALYNHMGSKNIPAHQSSRDINV